MGGIYAITHESGKAYIGSSVNFQKRWNEHKRRLRRGIHTNQHLQRAWALYGESAFEFVICEYVDDPERLHVREQYFLDLHRMFNEVYNLGLVARHPMLGRPMPEETRRKISEAHKGMRHTEEARRRMSVAQKGNQCALGHEVTEEARRKLGEAHGRPYPAFINRITGETIPAGVNLRALCRERRLNQSGMAAVVRGAQSHCKGWMLLSEHIQPWLL